MAESIRWYLALVVIGGGGLLPAALLCGRLRSAGVLYARPLALMLVAYAAWMLSHFAIVPYGAALVLALVAALWVWSAVLAWRRPALLIAVRAAWRVLAVGEVVFVLLLVLIAVARTQAPTAIHTEKPMDLMLLTAVHRAEQLPPPDPWLAGERVAYYHLGHVAVDVVGQLSANGPGIAFNLGLAMTGALAGAAALALAGDVVALTPGRRACVPWVAGGVAVCTLLWLSTGAGAIEIAAANGLGGSGWWGRLGVPGLPGPEGASAGVPTDFWWWWRATRILPNGVATEFPAFSLLLGDLHAHLLALPVGIVAVALAVATLVGPAPAGWRSWRAAPVTLLLSAVLFAALLMVNSWDVLTFGALWLAAALLAARAAGRSLPVALRDAAGYLAPPTALAVLLVMPFLAGFDGLPFGLTLVTGEHSDPGRFLLVWLTPLLPVAVGAGRLAADGRLSIDRTIALALAGALLALLVLWCALLIAGGEGAELTARGAGWITLGALAAALALLGGGIARAGRAGDGALAAGLGLVALALALVLLTELVRTVDALPSRFNTVFKFWFHAWLLLATGGAVLLALALDRVPVAVLRVPRARHARVAGCALTTVAALGYASGLLYAPAMAISRGDEGQTRGLDALAGLRTLDPGLAAAAAWARRELDPAADVLLQAAPGPGDEYSTYALLAAASGVPTLLGPVGNHERQWRGPLPTFAERARDADAIYGGGANAESAALARRWGIDYVYLGREERVRYGAGVADAFSGWPTAFAAAGALIVAVPAADAAAQP